MDGQSIGLLVAFTAGFLSFLSPCVLPLIPSYATFITGMSLNELGSAGVEGLRRRRTALVHGLIFVSGFTLVFMMAGAGATLLGSLFGYYRFWIERVGGVLLILFGLVLLNVVRIPGSERDWRVHLADKPAGYFGTLVVGIAFGAGWTPCLGPVLGGILTLAATQDNMTQGMTLLGFYSLGLAVPFLAATVAIQQFLGGMQHMRRWMPWVSRISGALLILVGLLLVTGYFTWLNAVMMRWTPDFLMERL
jgi:cytochrome c-type biogenesis protein